MVRQRVRIRFRKEGDLRLIGHRDLARTMERWFRRAGLDLRMSQGFHPKPRMSFPSALAVGVEGADEVMELELNEMMTKRELAEALSPHAPPGLRVTSVEPLPPGAPKAQVSRVAFEMPVPAERRNELERRIAELLSASTCLVDRGAGHQDVDLRALLESLELDGGTLRMWLRVSRQGSVRPREVLLALGIDDLEGQGFYLTRSAVELES